MERGFEDGCADWRIGRAAELVWTVMPYGITPSYDDLHDARQEAWLRCLTYLPRPQYAGVGWVADDDGSRRPDDDGLRRFVRKQLTWAAQDVIGSTSRAREQPASARLTERDHVDVDGVEDIGPYGVKEGRSVTARRDCLDPTAVAGAREGLAAVGAWLRGLERVERLIFELRRGVDPQPGWPAIARAVEATLDLSMSPASARQIYQRLQNKADEDARTAVVFELLGRRTRADRGIARRAA